LTIDIVIDIPIEFDIGIAIEFDIAIACLAADRSLPLTL
jgi:hypothetical protein